MQIEHHVSGDGNQRRMIITHDGNSLEWNIGFTNGLKDMRPLVRDINGYWAKMSITRQNQIFAQYAKIYEIFETVINESRILMQLRREMEVLFDMHPYAEAEEYVRRFGQAKYPKDLRTEYGVGAPNNVLTYLRPDYQGLLVLTLLMRVALPVLGAYIQRVAVSAGTVYKELKALSIMTTTHLVESPSYKKLSDYIQTYTNPADNPLSAVVNGLGTENRLDWLLAQTLIRRIAISELVYNDEEADAHNLVRSIYNSIRNLIDAPDKRHGGPIRDKIPSAGDNDDNVSRAELIKVKQPVSEGNLIAYSVYAEQYLNMATRIDQSVDPILVEAAIIKLRSDNDYSAEANQITLIQWVINCVIPARGVPQLEYEALICAAGVTQALLWHWGFFDLAAIVTAKKQMIPSSTMMGLQRNKPTKDQLAKLIKLYPHHSMASGKAPRPTFDGSMSHETVEQINLANNVALNAINLLSADLANAAWALRLPEEYQQELTLSRSEYGWTIAPTIRNQLADLVIKTSQLK